MIYNPENRYRERKKHQIIRLFGQFVLIGIAATLGYWFAGQGEVGETANHKARAALLEQERDELQASLTALKGSEQMAAMKYEQLQASAQEILGNDDLQEIVLLAREQLEKGMAADRLAYIVRAGKPPTGCTDPVIDRFVVATPNYEGEKPTLTLADGAIQISGEGRSANNDVGEAEAWFDPNMPVRAYFAVTASEAEDPEVTQKRRSLPFYHSVILGDREYRFTLSEGAKSFVKVTYDSCDYP